MVDTRASTGSVYGLSWDVVGDMRQTLAELLKGRDRARAYTVPERCELVRHLLGNGPALTPGEMAGQLADLTRYEVTVAIDAMRAELQVEYRKVDSRGGRRGYWSLKAGG